MVREDKVIMSVKELRRVHVIRQAMEKKLTQVQAGILLGLTPRHIRRLIERVAQAGDQGLAHRGRGKPSNLQIPEPVKTKALTLYEQQYGDFGPTLAAEKLAELQGMVVNAETLRGWLLAKGGDTLPATEAAAPSVAGTESPCGGVGAAGWVTPRLVRGPGASQRAHGLHR